MKYQCYYYYHKTGYIGGRAYIGQKMYTRIFDTEKEAEDFCANNLGEGQYEMLYEEIPTPVIRFHNIVWEGDEEGDTDNLPKEVLVKDPDNELVDEFWSGYDDRLADYLSDEYGFLVESFESEIVA